MHLKLESLLKDDPINDWHNSKARNIMAIEDFAAAIHCPLANELKKRLKLCLKDNVIYADGLRPDQISSRLRSCTNAKYYFSNDQEK